MGIDYKAIAERIERRRAIYDKPHPWEQEHPNKGPWELSYLQYDSLDRNTEYDASAAIRRFLRRHNGLSSLEIYAMLLHGKIQLPHGTDCAKCNQIRELKKKVKKNRRS